jgi:hypothetical protein
LQVPPPSSTRARRLPSLVLLVVVCHTALLAFAFTRASAWARRSRASVHPSTRAHQTGRRGWTFGPFSCAGPRGCASVDHAAMASPWPDASRTWSQGRERRPLGRRVHTLPRAPLPRTRVSADRGRLARCHPWRRPELRRCLLRVAPFAADAEPSRAVHPTRAHPSARPRTRVHAPPHQEGAPAPPAEHRHRANVVVPTPATTSPRQPPPSSLCSFEPSDPRESFVVIQ